MEQHKSSKELLNNNILEYIDLLRIDASTKMHHLRKSELRQYFSDASLSRLMASMFSFKNRQVRILDPSSAEPPAPRGIGDPLENHTGTCSNAQ